MSVKTRALTGLAVVGTLTTAALGIRAGVLCCKKLNEEITRNPNWEAGNGDTLKLCAKELIPVLFAGGMTSLVILANEHEHNSIEAGLATALVAATEYISQQDDLALGAFLKPSEDIPPKKDDTTQPTNLRYALGQGYFSSFNLEDEIESLGDLPPQYGTPNNIQKTGLGNFLFYDAVTETWFRSSPSAILAGIINLNRNIAVDNNPTVVEWCDTFRIKCPKYSEDSITGHHLLSEQVGWNYDYIANESVLGGIIWLDIGRYIYDVPGSDERCMIISPELYPADLEYTIDYTEDNYHETN